jgi:pyruvate dehydrogenase E1 component alpha subunit
MGDATTNIGAWHESLNLAALWDLPVVYFIVNNGYGMGTTVDEGAAEPDLYKRGAAFRMHGERVDGRDVLAVRDAMVRLRERANAEKKPAILEAISFRFRGHSVIDADRYRDPEEVKQGRAQDPVSMFAQQLSEAGIVNDDWLKETAKRVEREVQESIDFAEKSPDPKIEDLFDFMYATPVPNTPGREEALAIARQAQGGR